MFDRVVRRAALGVLGLVVLLSLATPIQAAGQPLLYLPTPPGETWEVIQGYNCGSHDGWGHLSFDLVNHDGRTRGAPVFAAADGTILFHGGQTNSLILKHAGGYYTMYSHMQEVVAGGVGTPIQRGQWIGAVGSVNPSPTVPHLHFTFFKADGEYASNRRAVPLAFAEGYDFPNDGTCSQHEGALLVAGGSIDNAPPSVEWTGTADETWVISGRVDWTVSDDQAVSGFSQAWDGDPAGDAPQFSDATTGYFDLTMPGAHTIFVRAWDAAGKQTLATREVWFDPNPPTAPNQRASAASSATAASSAKPLIISWQPGSDAESGVKGYQLYLGSDAQGTDEWFVAEPLVDVGTLKAGRYFLRVRTQDNAGNFSEWVTVETFDVK
jgi:hypothetical protein